MSGICDECMRTTCEYRADDIAVCGLPKTETNWERMFGTPERSARTLAKACGECSEKFPCSECPLSPIVGNNVYEPEILELLEEEHDERNRGLEAKWLAKTPDEDACDVIFSRRNEYGGEGCDTFEFRFSCGHSVEWLDEDPPKHCPECGLHVRSGKQAPARECGYYYYQITMYHDGNMITPVRLFLNKIRIGNCWDSITVTLDEKRMGYSKMTSLEAVFTPDEAVDFYRFTSGLDLIWFAKVEPEPEFPLPVTNRGDSKWTS